MALRWLALLASVTPTDATHANVTRLGLMVRLSGTDGESLGPTWSAISCGALLGANHVNARDGRIVPALSELPATTPYIDTLVLDSASTPRGGIQAYRDGISRGAAAFVGPARSSTARAVASLSSIDEVPIVSFWASAPQLGQNDFYSYFCATRCDVLAHLFAQSPRLSLSLCLTRARPATASRILPAFLHHPSLLSGLSSYVWCRSTVLPKRLPASSSDCQLGARAGMGPRADPHGEQRPGEDGLQAGGRGVRKGAWDEHYRGQLLHKWG